MNIGNKFLKINIQFPSSFCLANSRATKEEKIAFCDRQMENIGKIADSKVFEPFVVEGMRATSKWWLNERVRLEKEVAFEDFFIEQLPTHTIPALDSYRADCSIKENDERIDFCRERLKGIKYSKNCAKLRTFWEGEIGALQCHNAVRQWVVDESKLEVVELIKDNQLFQFDHLGKTKEVLRNFLSSCWKSLSDRSMEIIVFAIAYQVINDYFLGNMPWENLLIVGFCGAFIMLSENCSEYERVYRLEG